MTAIEWTDRTWNPVTGCTKVSPGCAHCYAETVAERFWGKQYAKIPYETRTGAMGTVVRAAALAEAGACVCQLDERSVP